LGLNLLRWWLALLLLIWAHQWSALGLGRRAEHLQLKSRHAISALLFRPLNQPILRTQT